MEIVLVVALVVFLFGRRRGKKKDKGGGLVVDLGELQVPRYGPRPGRWKVGEKWL